MSETQKYCRGLIDCSTCPKVSCRVQLSLVLLHSPPHFYLKRQRFSIHPTPFTFRTQHPHIVLCYPTFMTHLNQSPPDTPRHYSPSLSPFPLLPIYPLTPSITLQSLPTYFILIPPSTNPSYVSSPLPYPFSRPSSFSILQSTCSINHQSFSSRYFLFPSHNPRNIHVSFLFPLPICFLLLTSRLLLVASVSLASLYSSYQLCVYYFSQ